MLPFGASFPINKLSTFSDNNPLNGAASQLAAVLNKKEKITNMVITAKGQIIVLSQSNHVGNQSISIVI